MTYEQQYEQYLVAINEALPQETVKVFNGASAVTKAAEYSLYGGGKRVRAILCLAVCDMLAGNMQAAAAYACAVEMLHCYSLIHDDLPCMDNDDMRRGRPSCHKAFGEATAMLAGDALLTASFGVAASAAATPAQNMAAVAALSAAGGTAGMIYGQELDIAAEKQAVSQVQLENIHHYKTGMLIDAAATMGAVAANADAKTREIISEYAFAVGLVFQIVDDVLDVTADEAALGKPTGSDMRNEKTTYVTLLGVNGAMALAQKLTDNACAQLQGAFGEKAGFLCTLGEKLIRRSH